MTTKPYNVKRADLTAEWHVIDARDKTLGRISSEIAILLQGKHKPNYTPHLPSGDFVIVVNADKFRVSGNKVAAKKYYRYSGYHGGLTEETLRQVLDKDPTRVIKQAVKGMLPRNIQGKHMLSRLKLYVDEDHPHEAQVNAGRNVSGLTEQDIPKAQTKKTYKPAAETVSQAQLEVQTDLDSRKTSSEPHKGTETAVADKLRESKGSSAAIGDLSALTVPKLRELAKQRGLSVPSKARKADIIEALESVKTD